MVILICILLFVLTGIGCWALCAAEFAENKIEVKELEKVKNFYEVSR